MSLSGEDAGKPYGADRDPEATAAAFTAGEVDVAVYGLGKMGLPIAAVFAALTSRVVGVDVDEDVVDRVNAGVSPVEGEPGLGELVDRTVDAGALRATTDAAGAAAWADLHLLIVPTTVTDDARVDLSNLRAAVEHVAGGLEEGDLVVVESTVPPGTTADVVAPTLVAESGLDPGTFGLAVCPERTQSGRAIRDIRESYPRVVGGVDDESTAVARAVYEQVTEAGVVPVSDATTAEAVKVFEGVYRDVNIALANELAGFVEELGIDVVEAIEAANTQPFCDIHDPGVGVGGHCIPYYPYFLVNDRDTRAPLVRTARGINDGMPYVALTKLTELLGERGVTLDDARVLVLGLTYRPGVAETRESPAWPIIEHLDGVGATVLAVDPVLEELPQDVPQPTVVRTRDVEGLELDAAVLVTGHEQFQAIDWAAMPSMVVLDGRGALEVSDDRHTVYTIGSG